MPGPDGYGPNSGITRSLQVDVGEDRKGNNTAGDYADLDCSNPAQDVWSFLEHIFGH